MRKPLDSSLSGGIDLHIHSTASDGTCTPSEIVAMAVQLGLKAISITDHDTLAGNRNVLADVIPTQLNFLTGLEISTQAPEGFAIQGSLHILGYGIDPDNEPLEHALSELQLARDQRNPQIIQRLNQLGIPITHEQVMAHAGQGSAGRPHIAQAMIELGVVNNVNEAFDRFLSKGQPAYVDKYRIDIQRALDLIHAAGGASVLAHPYLIPGEQSQTVPTLVHCLKAMGLMGIEVYYPHHSSQDVRLYLEMADQFDLAITGGTDFHGDLLPDIELGRGNGDLYIPMSVYKTLTSKIETQQHKDYERHTQHAPQHTC